ncbi:exonuclease SbcCD subunit D [Succinimonas sp.]|uniref:metallophosphoesterase family protein n=1 Tax=Succinimonas sp. TaxID=1936151 RepID=UPI00386E30AE
MTSENRALRILHTSDWHLGKRLHDFDRSQEYEYFRKSLLESIAEGKPEVMLIAGDIFDNVTPSFDAEKFFGNTLNMIRRENPDLHIVVTSGNHDSGRKIDNISIYMETCDRLRITGELPVIISGENGSVMEPDYEKLVYPVYNGETLRAVIVSMPFLTPAGVSGLTLNSDAGDYETAVRNLYQSCLACIRERYPEAREGRVPVIAMGHFYVKNSAIGEQDENKVNILGGEGQVSAQIFDGYDYTALGHIHLRQNIIEKSLAIRYSGSPLPVNFGELNYSNGVDMVDFRPSSDGKAGFAISVQTKPFKRSVEFIRIPQRGGTAGEDEVFDILDGLSARNEENVREKNPGGLPFLSVFALYDPEHSAFSTSREFRDVLESKLNNLAGRLARICDKNVILKTAASFRNNNGDQDIQDLRDITDPMTLAERMYREVNHGADMSSELRALLSDIIREAEGTQETSGSKGRKKTTAKVMTGK